MGVDLQQYWAACLTLKLLWLRVIPVSEDSCIFITTRRYETWSIIFSKNVFYVEGSTVPMITRQPCKHSNRDLHAYDTYVTITAFIYEELTAALWPAYLQEHIFFFLCIFRRLDLAFTHSSIGIRSGKAPHNEKQHIFMLKPNAQMHLFLIPVNCCIT